MERLHGPIRDYAWGSRSVLAQLQGRPVPADGPEAELWLGAHPGGPGVVSRPAGPIPLPDLLAREPEHWLGGEVLRRFGPRLPFLLKILAPERPLSLQAHPDAEQARAGYAAEEVAGVHRNYADPYHKPELLVALQPFEALCGFRDPAISAEVLAALRLDALAPVVAALRTGVAGLAEAVRLLLTWPESERAGLVGAAVRASAAPALAGRADLVGRLARDYPDDPGVLVALLLNEVRLAPDEAIWMPAGNLHAYLNGCGVEILAASDNVLRGGLTPKRVDVPELLGVLRFEVLTDPVLKPEPLGPGLVTWPVPVEDFALRRARVGGAEPVRLEPLGPRVVLCTEGRVTVGDAAGSVDLGPGAAAFGAAVAGPLSVDGDGEAYVASVADFPRSG
ncbi:mannose-6-phosphate isomerase, class I [Plantactinospora sp. GCM10030261]|uniref:mannose-6-phosphate isomerase, class I n=1 Tax=Plantactinospora sp. GCM10030261 TaxID=3273420 RepID=UPI003607BA6E